jgi:hypothetical protein
VDPVAVDPERVVVEAHAEVGHELDADVVAGFDHGADDVKLIRQPRRAGIVAYPVMVLAVELHAIDSCFRERIGQATGVEALAAPFRPVGRDIEDMDVTSMICEPIRHRSLLALGPGRPGLDEQRPVT